MPLAISAKGFSAVHDRAEPLLRLARQRLVGANHQRPRGFDAGKKVKGRKRHLAVDTIGLPIECQITTADVQDRDALPPLLKAVHGKSPWVKMSFVDGGYQGDEAQRAAFEASRISITVGKRTDKEVKGFIVLPKRWVVARTLGWINRARRLSKDFEATIEIRSRVAAIGLGFPSHAKAGQGKSRAVQPLFCKFSRGGSFRSGDHAAIVR